MPSFKHLWFWTALTFCALSVASASNQSCTKVTFPNVLGFGDCLGAPVDMCICNTNVNQFTQSMLLCAVHGMSYFDVPTQLYFLQGILKEALSSMGLQTFLVTTVGSCWQPLCRLLGANPLYLTTSSNPLRSGTTGNLAKINVNVWSLLSGFLTAWTPSVGNPISSLLDVVGGVLGGVGNALLGRSSLVSFLEEGRGLLGGLLDPIFGGSGSPSDSSSGKGAHTSSGQLPLGQCSKPDQCSAIVCGSPAEILFPSKLNLAKCLPTRTTKCDGTSKNQMLVLQELFQTIACVFSRVLATSSSNDKNALCCVVLVVLKYMLSASTQGIFNQVLDLLGGAIKQQCGSTSF
ncbi:hypothetical protein V5799_029384 [Amblyomma americanum]|uniref:Secreted protein n=1 Tax=Amblyomma americanum TaxID=6943 RepID=A0AAQ4ERA2_AMBAM